MSDLDLEFLNRKQPKKFIQYADIAFYFAIILALFFVMQIL